MTSQPVIILVRPQMGENIGHVARAMANFGLNELRLVAPRDGWPNPAAEATSAGATWVLEGAQVFATAEEAVADLEAVYATTARNREMIKHIATPRHAASMMRQNAAEGRQFGILFGAEATGLTNDELVLAETLVTIPANPEFTSINIGQAVLLLAYEWFQAGDQTPAVFLPAGENKPVTQKELEGFFQHIEQELTLSGFFRPPEKTPHMKRNVRSIFQRMGLLDQDIRTLRGIVKSLALYGRSAGKKRAED